jgi:hypothetical protein
MFKCRFINVVRQKKLNNCTIQLVNVNLEDVHGRNWSNQPIKSYYISGGRVNPVKSYDKRIGFIKDHYSPL